MKNIVILFCMIFFLSVEVSSQEDNRKMFTVGIKVGANVSNVYDDDGDDFIADSKFGFAAGAFVTIPLGANIGIQPEIVFSQKGFKGQGSLIGSSYKLTRTSNFIDVPIYFTIKPLSTLTILAGPQFSFLTKQKDVFENSQFSYEQSEIFKNENLRKNILGISLGLDLNINNTVLGARAGMDLTKNNGNGTSSTPRYKNIWLQVTVGFRFF